jgi:FkbH-like protein
MTLDFSGLQKAAKAYPAEAEGAKYKLAILGNYTTGYLKKAVGFHSRIKKLNLELYEADYDQVEQEILDPTSRLYEFQPNAVLITLSARKMRGKFFDLAERDKQVYSEKVLSTFEQYVEVLSERLPCKIPIANLEEINDNVFGNFSAKTRLSFINHVRRINTGLQDIAERNDNAFLIDVQSIYSNKGEAFAFSPSMYVNADMAFSLDFTALMADSITNVIASLKGKFKKCAILDLDNTLWGGIIGDDGLENIQIGSLGIGKAFTEFQQYLKTLKDRGIILAVCSKNEDNLAKEPFEKHPEMTLRLDDIAVFVANWENKVDNIRQIQEILNIGFDSMVFFDDNPAEREIVKMNLPDVLVPDLPEDPAEYLPYVSSLNLFETTSYSANDSERTKQYQTESKRLSLSKQYTDVNEFLRSLDMVADVRPFADFDVPRIAQLSQRSNQFNVRTIRYTEDDIRRIKNSSDYLHYAVNLKDKFGEYGLISIVILEKKDEQKLFADTWIMSCRVLKRGVEQKLLNDIVKDARESGFTEIIGEYLPTPKNALVRDLFPNLGFTKNGDLWSLNVETYVPHKIFIKDEKTTEVGYGA